MDYVIIILSIIIGLAIIFMTVDKTDGVLSLSSNNLSLFQSKKTNQNQLYIDRSIFGLILILFTLIMFYK